VARKITGTVVRQERKRLIPLRYVRVCISDNQDIKIECTSTDALGRYRFDIRIAEGDYLVQVQYQGKIVGKIVPVDYIKEFTVDLPF
jgi:hypothetical protein